MMHCYCNVYLTTIEAVISAADLQLVRMTLYVTNYFVTNYKHVDYTHPQNNYV